MLQLGQLFSELLDRALHPLLVIIVLVLLTVQYLLVLTYRLLDHVFKCLGAVHVLRVKWVWVSRRQTSHLLIPYGCVKVSPFQALNHIIKGDWNIYTVPLVVFVPFKVLVNAAKPGLNNWLLEISIFINYLISEFICLSTTFDRTGYALNWLTRLFLGFICAFDTYLLTRNFKEIISVIRRRLHTLLFFRGINQTSSHRPLRSDHAGGLTSWSIGLLRLFF